MKTIYIIPEYLIVDESITTEIESNRIEPAAVRLEITGEVAKILKAACILNDPIRCCRSLKIPTFQSIETLNPEKDHERDGHC